MNLRGWIDPELLAVELLGTTMERWLLLLAAVAVSTVVLFVLRRFIGGWLKRYENRTERAFNAVVAVLLQKTRGYFLFALALTFAAYVVGWNERGQAAVLGLLTLATLLQTGRWGNSLITLWLRRQRRQRLADDAASVATLSAIAVVARVLLWSIILLMVLDNLGVDVTALVAGLGISGIVIGFALQNVLGDVFASLSILLDKPFVLGDSLAVGDFIGTVENVGLKSTRLRSLGGEQIIFANSQLLDSRIRNYGRMHERRVQFGLALTYDTAPEQLESVTKLVRGFIEAQEHTRFGRAHFKGHGEWALEFEFVYHVLSPDHTLYMDIHEAISLAIHREFEARGIRFAFPTQTLHLERTRGGATTEPADNFQNRMATRT